MCGCERPLGYHVRSYKERMWEAGEGYRRVKSTDRPVSNNTVRLDTSSTAGTTDTVTLTMPTDPPLLRAGEKAQVTADGLLKNRVGMVSGFMAGPKGRLVFVSWPGGGWGTFLDEDLQKVTKKVKKDGP